MERKYRLYIALGLLSCLMFASCSDWDEFKKYTKNGEIVYPGKFDSVAIFPGKERVRIWGKLTADPNVKSAKVLWDNGQQSAEFEIDPSGAFDEIVNVEEGVKSFTLHTFDDQGNKSIGVTSTGVSYGERYRNTLANRRIKRVVYTDTVTTIVWEPADPNLFVEAVEVRFKNLDGEEVIVRTAVSAGDTTLLPGFDYMNEEISWRTSYRPISSSSSLASIDTFLTEFGGPKYVETEVDRALFKAENFAGDTWANGGSGGVKAMWDGQAQNSYGGANFTDIGSGQSSPQMVTFSIGGNTPLSKIVIYPFQEWWGSYYVFSTIRDYEIYGSSNPNPDGSLDDTWTLLASGTFAKPSGLGKDNESDADKAAAAEGFTVPVDPAAPKVNYIRIRCLKNYEGHWTGGNQAFFSVAEIKVFGKLPQ